MGLSKMLQFDCSEALLGLDHVHTLYSMNSHSSPMRTRQHKDATHSGMELCSNRLVDVGTRFPIPVHQVTGTQHRV